MKPTPQVLMILSLAHTAGIPEALFNSQSNLPLGFYRRTKGGKARWKKGRRRG